MSRTWELYHPTDIRTEPGHWEWIVDRIDGRDPRAVSPERAEELKHQWRENWNRWADQATDDQLDEWAELMAPLHPEWFTNEEARIAAWLGSPS